jgi:formate transporter
MADIDTRLDALIPVEMAEKAEAAGVKKASLDFWTMFGLAVLAGAFIGIAAEFATTVSTGAADKLPFGMARLVTGLVFSMGLILVVVGGAELFTGNNLIVMAWAARKVSTVKMLRNWGIVFVGNFVGAILTALLVFASEQYTQGGGQVGLTALNTANLKAGLGFTQAVALGILCNALVCMAVWLCFSARSTTDKILAIIFPITAFVASGFEHNVANMYFIPLGLFVKQWAPAGFWQKIGKAPADFGNLSWSNFLLKNLLPVTIGNIIGGAVLVGLAYWFIFLRRKLQQGETRLANVSPVSGVTKSRKAPALSE